VACKGYITQDLPGEEPLYILSECKVALTQRRYIWRHDYVIGELADMVKGEN
jgi:hypothetical protein